MSSGTRHTIRYQASSELRLYVWYGMAWYGIVWYNHCIASHSMLSLNARLHRWFSTSSNLLSSFARPYRYSIWLQYTMLYYSISYITMLQYHFSVAVIALHLLSSIKLHLYHLLTYSLNRSLSYRASGFHARGCSIHCFKCTSTTQLLSRRSFHIGSKGFSMRTLMHLSPWITRFDIYGIVLMF